MGACGEFLLLVAVLVFAVLISVVAQAQVLPGGSSQHHLWDAANKLLFASHGVLEAVDFGITLRNLSDGGREMNSMAKALCESGTAGQLVFFGGRMGTELGTTNWSGLLRFTSAGFCLWGGLQLRSPLGLAVGRKLTDLAGGKRRAPPLRFAPVGMTEVFAILRGPGPGLRRRVVRWRRSSRRQQRSRFR
jgi:hypothetical protein